MGRRTVRGKGPMLAKLETALPTGPGWTYEPKWDGFRCLVTVDGDGSFVSRDDRPMMRYFPEVVEMLDGLDAGTFIADGELVLVRHDGALSFEELQLRLHPAASRVKKLAGEIPATLFLFDLLREGDEDLQQRPLSERRDRLPATADRPPRPPWRRATLRPRHHRGPYRRRAGAGAARRPAARTGDAAHAVDRRP